MIALNDISHSKIDLSGVDLSGIRFGDMDVKSGGQEIEYNAILLEDGSNILLANGSVLLLEETGTENKVFLNKSYWNL